MNSKECRPSTSIAPCTLIGHHRRLLFAHYVSFIVSGIEFTFVRVFVPMALLLLSLQGAAADSLIIGKELAPFELNNIAYYPSTHLNTQNFRGKWLILDFWSRGCTACVAGFPYMNSLRKQFSDKAEILLVAREDANHEVDSIYERARKFGNLDLPSAFDSAVFQKFDFHSVPQVLILDDKGVLRGWVNHVSSQDLADLIDGKRSQLVNPVSMAFDFHVPYLLNGNGGSDDAFVCRSLLATWEKGQPFFSPGTIRMVEANHGVFQAVGVPLSNLYDLAYFGFDLIMGGTRDPNFRKVYLHPLLKMRDTSLFAGNMRVLNGRWSYSLALPSDKASERAAKRKMQHDLNDYFGYTAEIRTEDCPYLALVADSNARKSLPTKGGLRKITGTVKAKFTMTNCPVNWLADLLSCSPDREMVQDETGLAEIDLTLDEDLTNPRSVLNALRQNGLDLVWKKKPMQVVVISDAD